MIRFFVLAGTAGIVLASYLTVYQTSAFQASPARSQLTGFQVEGLAPDPNAVVENEEVEHGIFEVPEEDERQLEMALNMGGMNKGGMNMGGMKMPMDADGKTAMKMPMDDDGKSAMKMPMDADGKSAMKMPMDADGKSAMKMPMDGDGKSEMKMPMDADGKTAMKMPMDDEEKADGEAKDGLKITEEGSFDREISLTMAEWRFSNMDIAVKSGERIRFNVTNGGNIPHEFMFMTMPAMAAVNYRAQRADWNLLEHEALFEKSLVLPGGKFSFVAEIAENGAWMFMCMLPYHMQMGMMGQMATPGRAMDMNMAM